MSTTPATSGSLLAAVEKIEAMLPTWIRFAEYGLRVAVDEIEDANDTENKVRSLEKPGKPLSKDDCLAANARELAGELIGDREHEGAARHFGWLIRNLPGKVAKREQHEKEIEEHNEQSAELLTLAEWVAVFARQQNPVIDPLPLLRLLKLRQLEYREEAWEMLELVKLAMAVNSPDGNGDVFLPLSLVALCTSEDESWLSNLCKEQVIRWRSPTPEDKTQHGNKIKKMVSLSDATREAAQRSFRKGRR